MDAISMLTQRRSVRSYTSDPIKKQDLETILDCGRLAPSGLNRQGWKFIVCQSQEQKQALANASIYSTFIATAGAIVVVATDETAVTFDMDAAAATTNMLNAAHALGYGGCWIGANGNAIGQDAAKIVKLPKNWKVVTIFCIGAVDKQPEQRPKKALDEVVSYETFM